MKNFAITEYITSGEPVTPVDELHRQVNSLICKIAHPECHINIFLSPTMGQWSDYLTSIKNGTIQAASATVTMTYERTKEMTFSYPVYAEKYGILLPEASTEMLEITLLEPLSREIWFLFAILLVSTAIMSTLSETIGWDSFLKWAFRVPTGGHLTGIILSVFKLAYSQTVLRALLPASNGLLFHDVKGSFTAWKGSLAWPVVGNSWNDSLLYSALRSSKISASELSSIYHRKPPLQRNTMREAIKAVAKSGADRRNRDSAVKYLFVVMDYYELLARVKEFWETKSNLVLVVDSRIANNLAYALPLKSKDRARSLSEAVILLTETGIPQRLNSYYFTALERMTNAHAKSRKGQRDNKPITAYQMEATLRLLVLSHAIAAILFFAERSEYLYCLFKYSKE